MNSEGGHRNIVKCCFIIFNQNGLCGKWISDEDDGAANDSGGEERYDEEEISQLRCFQ